MRQPDLDHDGWCLDDAEIRHSNAPDTFWIPERNHRETLQPGDIVQLLFEISVDDQLECERMWVIVRECIPEGYLGILDNNPFSIEENDELWSGIELPFAARHVIDIRPRDEKTIALARQEPKRRWV